MQRGIAKHAFHQVHSCRGKHAEPRSFSSCCVCARGFWKEDLRPVKLFVTALGATELDEVNLEDPANDQDEAEEEKEQDDGVLSISPQAVARLHSHIFDVYRYSRLWPLIPLAELLASTVEHPTGKDKAGRAWRWFAEHKDGSIAARSRYCRGCLHGLLAELDAQGATDAQVCACQFFVDWS